MLDVELPELLSEFSQLIRRLDQPSLTVLERHHVQRRVYTVFQTIERMAYADGIQGFMSTLKYIRALKPSITRFDTGSMHILMRCNESLELSLQGLLPKTAERLLYVFDRPIYDLERIESVIAHLAYCLQVSIDTNIPLGEPLTQKIRDELANQRHFLEKSQRLLSSPDLPEEDTLPTRKIIKRKRGPKASA